MLAYLVLALIIVTSSAMVWFGMRFSYELDGRGPIVILFRSFGGCLLSLFGMWGVVIGLLGLTIHTLMMTDPVIAARLLGLDY
ncbi:MAG: hypothetical protein AAB719_02590 [Patescibacteria group bacterium]